MKRFICMLAALVLVTTVVVVRPARAWYLGNISRCCSYLFEVRGTTRMSVTILSVTSNGRLDVEEVLVLDGNTVNVQQRTLPRTAERLIFKLDTPVNTSADFAFSGGGQHFALPVAGHEEVVFDVVP
jgi:hypothetical protein